MQDRFKFRWFSKKYRKVFKVACLEFPDIVRYIDEDGNQVNTSLSSDNGVLIQSTGIKDKNCKLIYEGDIIANVDFGCVAIIEYHPFSYSLMVHIRGMDDFVPIEDICYTDMDKDGTPFKIIGNIYENPELLEH